MGNGIAYGHRNKKVRIKDMHGNDDVERDTPGWLCRCQTCREIGYITIGATVPDYCEDCYEKAHGP